MSRILTCCSPRSVVYGILAFEWVQTGLVTANAFQVFVYNFGDVPNLLKFHNSWFSVPIMCGVVSVAVQFFYARRIFVLSGSVALAAVICLVRNQPLQGAMSGADSDEIGAAGLDARISGDR